MTGASDREQSDQLPDALVACLDGLDDRGLRGVRSRIERRLASRDEPRAERIRADAAGEVLDIADRGPYTLVWVRHPEEAGATDPTGVTLYRVRWERQPDGGDRLHWSVLGDVVDPSDLDLGDGNGGR